MYKNKTDSAPDVYKRQHTHTHNMHTHLAPETLLLDVMITLGVNDYFRCYNDYFRCKVILPNRNILNYLWRNSSSSSYNYDVKLTRFYYNIEAFMAGVIFSKIVFQAVRLWSSFCRAKRFDSSCNSHLQWVFCPAPLTNKLQHNPKTSHLYRCLGAGCYLIAHQSFANPIARLCQKWS